MNTTFRSTLCLLALAVFGFCVVQITACTKQKTDEPTVNFGYPPDVAAIMLPKCATAGCHNEASKDGAGGLSLVSWQKMMEGSRAGAVVIPFRTDYSTFCYYTNTDATKGLTLLPTMPYNAPPLSATEYDLLAEWIANGAPDENGYVNFSDHVGRKKFYVTNQGCDVITVFDAETRLAMRYVSAGTLPNSTEAPHMVKVTPDNQYFCTSFIGGDHFQKFSVADNTLAGQVNIGFGSWNTFALSSDSRYAYPVDYTNGTIVKIDLENMTAQNIDVVTAPHGSMLNPTDDTLYVTAQNGNGIYKVPVDVVGGSEFIDLTQNFPISGTTLGIHEIIFSADGSRYYVSCQNTNEVRVVLTANDSVIAAIPVGVYPQEMALSTSKPYIVVTNMEDNVSFPGKRGSVSFINTETNTEIARVYSGHQPHGLAIDDDRSCVFIANRNVSFGGPAAHHASLCGGKNGYVTAIDLNTLAIIPGFRAEVSADPYGACTTH